MKILLLTFYYPPDLSPGSFRSKPIVDALLELMPAGSQIDVITTLPNRYHSFAAAAPLAEQQGALSIFRVPLPKHRSGKLDQASAFLAYFRGALTRVAGRDYDVVVATSGRLMTAVLGGVISRRKRAPLYLDIRDIFVDNIKGVFSPRVSWILQPLFSMVERWVVRGTAKVNLISPGFSDWFTTRYPGREFTHFTNGVDDEFLEAAPPRTSVPAGVGVRPISVLYAGNFGQGQGLEHIIPGVAKRMGSRLRFTLIGDGGRKRELETALARAGVTNVDVLPPIQRQALIEAYRAADVLFLHLNDYDSFKTVLPSKMFEYAAMGKPIWAGVAGYPAEFIKSEMNNSAVFDPCDVDGAVRVFESLVIHETPRTEFLAKFSRKTISRAMAADMLALAAKRG